MKFKKIMDCHDFCLENSAKPLRFTMFTALVETDGFSHFFSKNTKNNCKQEENKNWKPGNHRKSDFHKVLTHVGGGKSAISIILRKSRKFTKIIKFMKILEISINLVNKSYFLPEAEKSGKSQSES